MTQHQHIWTDMRLNLADAEECACGAVRETPTKMLTLTDHPDYLEEWKP